MAWTCGECSKVNDDNKAKCVECGHKKCDCCSGT
jgi:hypothetical protein